MVTRAVFLDRDGVLNANLERDGRPVAPTSLKDFQLLPGVPAAVQRLKDAGFLTVIVTNQPDVVSGRTPRHVVDAMHARLREDLPIDDIKVCFHRDEDHCACRKPKPGLILEAARDWDIDLGHSYIVGDRWRDMQAGREAGCQTIFVDYGYRQDGPMQPNTIVNSLPEAVEFILGDSEAAA